MTVYRVGIARPRLTRRESQARTRARLIDSAARSIVRNGLEGTTIEEIAERAGHTRGAFYAHFKSREDLYLAMLEDRFAKYVDRFNRTLAGEDPPEVRARRAGDDLTAIVQADPEWQRLYFEFAVYALRNKSFRRELINRQRALREGVAAVFRSRAEEAGVSSPIPLERLTLMTFAIATGFSLATLLEPDAFPDDLHGETLAILFKGLGTLTQGG
jgi:AcrR family transcriptional regulator